MRRILAILAMAAVLMLPAGAQAAPKLKTHTLYVTAAACFSGGWLDWASRLHVRNLDPDHSFTLESVGFYGPDGSFIMDFLTGPVVVAPWSSLTYLAASWTVGVTFDVNGGRPFFLVRYTAGHLPNEPIIASANVGLDQNFARAFDTSSSQEITIPWESPGHHNCRRYRSGLEYVSSAVGLDTAGQIWVNRLVVRNTDPSGSMNVLAVDFYSPDGTLLKRYLPTPQTLGPFQSATYGINPWDIGTPQDPYSIPTEGGRPFLIVQWSSEGLCNAPMIGAATMGVSDTGVVETYAGHAGRPIKIKGPYDPQ